MKIMMNMSAEDLNTLLSKSTIGRNGGKGKVRKFRVGSESSSDKKGKSHRVKYINKREIHVQD